MAISLIDWGIIVVYLVGCIAAGVWMRRYVRGVEDFAVAGRKMDVNLGIASLAATEMGLVTVMYTAEMGFSSGPAGATVGVLMAGAMLLVGMTGFVIKPLRDAGVITIPELFEKRFGKRIRWLAGLVVILGGLLNMGIFLRLGGEFLVRISGMDPAYLQWTMTFLLGIVLLYTVLGGMLSVLVTDYLQFLVMGLGLVITSLLVVWSVDWSTGEVRFAWPEVKVGLVKAHESAVRFDAERAKRAADLDRVVEAVRKTQNAEAARRFAKAAQDENARQLKQNAAELAGRYVLVSTKLKPQQGQTEVAPPKALTMGNPFNPFASNKLGWLYVVWMAIMQLAVVTTWQTMITRVLSAKDSQTARKVYRRSAFYFVGRFALPGLWGTAAFLYFCNQGGLPDGVDGLTAMPAFLKTILPAGIIGILLAAMLAAEMSTDSGYLLTWATVIYNDLISPCLRRPLSAKGKLFTVRAMVLAIGLFLLFWGLWYEIPGRAWDYLAVTGNIYLASLFALLVGALYWRGSNSWGAGAAIFLGALGPIAFLIVNAIVTDPAKQIKPEIAGFAAFSLAFAGMIVGSLVGSAMGKGNAHTAKETAQ